MHHLWILAENDARYLFYTQVATIATIVINSVVKWFGDRKERKEIKAKIEENTNISKKAFSEANNFNGKIKVIHDLLSSLSQTHGHETHQQTQDKIDEMSRTTQAFKGDAKA